MDPAEVRARVRLCALLFRAAMPLLAKALAAAGQAPPRAQEKERLLARLEVGAWDLPAALLGGDPDDEDAWEERVLLEPPVRALLEAAVGEAVDARRKG